jgi:outer membrane protein
MVKAVKFMKPVILFSGVNLLIVFGAVLYIKSTSPKFAYVKVTDVYNGFQLKKELEADYTHISQSQKLSLDSLTVQLKTLGNEISMKTASENDQKLYAIKRNEYLLKNKQISDANSTLTDKYDSEIWKQLNQYVNDFGKQHHYTFLIGASGTGNLMHADDSYDVTAEVIKYVNERYKGEKN